MSLPQSSADDLRGLLRAESHYAILKLMADQDRTWGDAAFQEFYDRHKSYLWTVCEDVGAALGCDAWVEDVFAETFHTAFKKAGAFRFPSCPVDEEDNVIKGWLGRIANNRLRSRWRQSRLEATCSDEQWETIADTADSGALLETDLSDEPAIDPPATANHDENRLMDEAMEQLADREAHVLRITSQFHRFGQKHQRLPNDVMDDLALSLGTTPENIRKIRERAKRKVRQYIDDHRRKDAR